LPDASLYNARALPAGFQNSQLTVLLANAQATQTGRLTIL
jgi:hypothetical protein